ncbi:MAG: hypothetical protein AAGF96_06055 [Bacteroidota bacterium]
MSLISCLGSNDQVSLLEVESELTVSSAMNSSHLMKLTPIIGKKNIVKAITYLTLRLAESFNMKGKFNETQAAILAIDLFDIFQYETLEDVVLMYKLARQGKIGDGMDFKLDGQTVLHKWVPAFLELKAIERENQHQSKKDESKVTQMPIHKSILKEAGKEKVTYKSDNSEGRHRNAMTVLLKRKSNEELKRYLIENDSKSETFDPAMYELVEQEIDFRNQQQKAI